MVHLHEVSDEACYRGTIATVLEQLGGVFSAKQVFDVRCRMLFYILEEFARK